MPGSYMLASVTIAGATEKPFTEIRGLDGMTSVTLEAQFSGGTGGTSLAAIVQTTIDGTNWLDVARFDFTGAGRKACTLMLQPSGVDDVAALGSEGVNQGILGNQLRAVVRSVGAYVNSSLRISAAVR